MNIIKPISTDRDDVIPPYIYTPRGLFKNWYMQYYKHNNDEKKGIVAILSTIQPNNTPYSRAIYIYNIDYTFNKTGKISFITNAITSKCNDIISNPNVSLLFLWKEHQIIISGKAYIADTTENNEVWNSRTHHQHVSSWNNYNIINNIKPSNTSILNTTIIKLPRVPNWCVVNIIPETFDFSYEGTLLSRIRVHYYLDENNNWNVKKPRINVIGCSERTHNLDS